MEVIEVKYNQTISLTPKKKRAQPPRCIMCYLDYVLFSCYMRQSVKGLTKTGAYTGVERNSAPKIMTTSCPSQ